VLGEVVPTRLVMCKVGDPVVGPGRHAAGLAGRHSASSELGHLPASCPFCAWFSDHLAGQARSDSAEKVFARADESNHPEGDRRLDGPSEVFSFSCLTLTQVQIVPLVGSVGLPYGAPDSTCAPPVSLAEETIGAGARSAGAVSSQFQEKAFRSQRRAGRPAASPRRGITGDT
jgi:hypothetical protein